MKKICVLTGAGMSAESGIKTFRDNDGLWENHDVMEVASPEGWNKDPELVLRFYNARRKQLDEVQPNAGHKALVDLEQKFDVKVITQNVDDLHERAGSQNIIHLHGELTKCRSIINESLIQAYDQPIKIGDLASDGHQLRPHIVWFGEAVPKLEDAVRELVDAEMVIIIGTSMQVYPAASLVVYAPEDAQIYYIDPNPTISYELRNRKNLTTIAKKAARYVPILVKQLLSEF